MDRRLKIPTGGVPILGQPKPIDVREAQARLTATLRAIKDTIETVPDDELRQLLSHAANDNQTIQETTAKLMLVIAELARRVALHGRALDVIRDGTEVASEEVDEGGLDEELTQGEQ